MRLLVAMALALAGAAAARAQGGGEAPPGAPPAPTTPSSALRLSGFGTLGVAHHDNDSLGVVQNFAQERPVTRGWSGNLDSVLGLQLDARLLPATSATLQGVVRAGDDYEPKLRMAYLRQGIGQDLAVRAGRMRSPFYLDSDVSEIGYAYLMTRPALPLYGVVANNVPSLDGADLQWRHQLGPAALLVQAYAGHSKWRQVFYNAAPPVEARGDLESIKGLAVSLGLPQVTLRASHTRVDRFTLRSPLIDQLNAGLAQVAAGLNAAASNPLLPPAVQAGLAAKAAAAQGFSNPYDNQPVYTSIGFDATLQNWRLMGEWALFDSQRAMVGRYRGWAATLGYTFREFTPYLTASRNDRRGAPADTSALAPTGLDPALDGALQQMRGALDQAALFSDLSSRSTGIGLRWDARDNLAVKVQYERLRSRSATTPGVFAVPGLPIDPTVRLFSATLDFVF